MNKLKNNELVKVNGGVFKIAASKFAIFGAIATFAIGFVSGIMRPSTCKSES